MRAGRVAELFAGVGGFRLGLEGSPDPLQTWQFRWPGAGRRRWRVTWSNQFEPSTQRVQHASDCYTERFGTSSHTNEDFVSLVSNLRRGSVDVPDIDLVVGGFPCQDYSVAKALGQAAGLKGAKGALWWAIRDFIRFKEPKFVFLENVDRLLKSPASARGRDFATILDSLNKLGYAAEWRVVNASEYGYPQRRRRVFLVATRLPWFAFDSEAERLHSTGPLARALPVSAEKTDLASLSIRSAIRSKENEMQSSPFLNAGLMAHGVIWTQSVIAARTRETPLARVLQEPSEVDDAFFIPRRQVKAWRELKNGKRLVRRHRASDTEYIYAEGSIPFPDSEDRPARTILTGEGGTTPSRFKHVIKVGERRYRRLTPLELERLNGFPDGWTETGMSDARRAFMMGNALVVGLVHRIGLELHKEWQATERPALRLIESRRIA